MSPFHEFFKKCLDNLICFGSAQLMTLFAPLNFRHKRHKSIYIWNKRHRSKSIVTSTNFPSQVDSLSITVSVYIFNCHLVLLFIRLMAPSQSASRKAFVCHSLLSVVCCVCLLNWIYCDSVFHLGIENMGGGGPCIGLTTAIAVF